MRICLVSQEYPPETGHGGIATQTYLKAHGLAGLGHEVHVLSHSVDAAPHRYRDGQVDVLRIPGPDQRLEIRTDSIRWLAWSQEVATALDDLQATNSIDLIDFPEYGAEGFACLLNRSGSRPRVVVQLHGPVGMLAEHLGWPEQNSDLHRVGAFMEATTVRLADAVISSSETSRDWSEKGYGIDMKAVPILHAGIDTQLFRPSVGAARHRPTILFVGKVGSSKGADVLGRAACRLADDIADLCVRFIGPAVGNAVTTLRSMADDSGFPDLFDFAGVVPRDQLPAEMGEADVLAVPSPYEGGPGYVYLEAMACGLPVIGCSGSGIEETIRHGDTGMLIPPNDSDQLAEVLLTLLGDDDLRRSMGLRARAFAEDEAETTACVSDIADFYASVVAR